MPVRNHKRRRRPYNPLTPKVAAALRRIVGEKYVVYNDPEKLEPYSHDEVAEKEYAHMPEALVRPETPEQIAKIMKLANKERIPVTPRGAGSGLSGGAVPLHGGIVLLLDRMNRILDVDRANMMITAEPGVVTNEINEVLRGTGLFYAGYPMSLEGENISILARVLRIVDVFDAMTSRRPYKEALNPGEAARIMIGSSTGQDGDMFTGRDDRDQGMKDCFDHDLLRRFIVFLGNVRLNG